MSLRLVGHGIQSAVGFCLWQIIIPVANNSEEHLIIRFILLVFAFEVFEIVNICLKSFVRRLTYIHTSLVYNCRYTLL
jgi:hypothetical protein